MISEGKFISFGTEDSDLFRGQPGGHRPVYDFGLFIKIVTGPVTVNQCHQLVLILITVPMLFSLLSFPLFGLVQGSKAD